MALGSGTNRQGAAAAGEEVMRLEGGGEMCVRGAQAEGGGRCGGLGCGWAGRGQAWS